MDAYQNFIAEFNRVDDVLREHYKIPIQKTKGFPDLLGIVEKENWFVKHFKSELISFNKLRNILVHVSPQPIAIPKDDVVKRFKEIADKIVHSLTKSVYDKCSRPVVTCNLNSCLYDVMMKMKKHLYTHVPVVDDAGRMIGLLSEGVFFNCLLEEEIFLLDKNTTVESIKDHLSIDKHDEEFIFVQRNLGISQVVNHFAEHVKSKKRLGAVFVTETGKSSQKLIGIITQADIASFISM